MKCNSKRSILLSMALMASAGTVSAASIAVNLVEADGPDTNILRADQSLLPTETAGLAGYVQSNWNNIGPGTTQNAILQDSTGAPTTASMQWSVHLAWGDPSAFNDNTSPGDSKLARGYFDDGDPANFGTIGSSTDDIGVTIRVSNVPYAEYIVLLYLASDTFNSDNGHLGTSTYGNYTVNGNTQNNGTPTSGQAWFETQHGTPWVLGQNVMLFDGLTSPTLEITAQDRVGSIRGSLAGFQIIQVPEPSTVALLAPLALFAWRRRR